MLKHFPFHDWTLEEVLLCAQMIHTLDRVCDHIESLIWQSREKPETYWFLMPEGDPVRVKGFDAARWGEYWSWQFVMLPDLQARVQRPLYPSEPFALPASDRSASLPPAILTLPVAQKLSHLAGKRWYSGTHDTPPSPQ